MRLLLVLTLAAAGSLLAANSAKVELKDANGKVVGTATLKESKGGVRISGQVRDLPPGVHAFHIHANGECTPPGFQSAGPHFNPTNKKHGDQNPDGHHLGDLPNITIDAKGRGKLNATVSGVTMDDAPSSVFKTGGTALVIHAKEDDRKSDPAGNAGDRIACGVIKK